MKNKELGEGNAFGYRLICVYTDNTYIQTVPKAHTNLKQARLFIKR